MKRSMSTIQVPLKRSLHQRRQKKEAGKDASKAKFLKGNHGHSSLEEACHGVGEDSQ